MGEPKATAAEVILVGLLVFAAGGAWPSDGDGWTAWRAFRLAGAVALLLWIAVNAVQRRSLRPAAVVTGRLESGRPETVGQQT